MHDSPALDAGEAVRGGWCAVGGAGQEGGRGAAGMPALNAEQLGTTPHPLYPADGQQRPRRGAAHPGRPASAAVLSACGAKRAPITPPGAGGLLASPGARKCRSRLILCCFPVEGRLSASLMRSG